MSTKIAIAGALFLAATPAGLTALWPAAGDASVQRHVAISGPIEAFTQTQDRIQVRLHPAANAAERAARRSVIVSDPNGGTLSIPLKPGQTWASGVLPPDLAGAGKLEIRVE